MPLSQLSSKSSRVSLLYIPYNALGQTIVKNTYNKLQESMILCICAMDAGNIDKAIKKIKDFQEREFLCEVKHALAFVNWMGLNLFRAAV